MEGEVRLGQGLEVILSTTDQKGEKRDHKADETTRRTERKEERGR